MCFGPTCKYIPLFPHVPPGIATNCQEVSMAGKVSTRKRGKKYEYRFEGATVGGKRQWITRGGFATAG